MPRVHHNHHHHHPGSLIFSYSLIIRRRQNASSPEEMGDLPGEKHVLLRWQDCDGQTGRYIIIIILLHIILIILINFITIIIIFTCIILLLLLIIIIITITIFLIFISIIFILIISGWHLLCHPPPRHRHLWTLLCLRLSVPHRTDLAGDPRRRRCPLHLRPLQLVEDELLGPGDHPEGDERGGGEHREGDRATQWGRPGL